MTRTYMTRSMNLTGKVALVTGASRGLGKGIALGLGEAGATVYVTARTEHAAQSILEGTVGQTAAEVTSTGGHGIAIKCDHGVDSEVEAVFGRIQEAHGRLDILVNNVTTLPEPRVLWGEQRFWELPLRIWDELFDVGLRSHYVATWFAAPVMIAQGSGLIVNISSPAATRKVGLLPYSVGKGALDRLTADLADELRPHGVSVVSVWPPPTTTEAVLAQAQVFGDLSEWKSPLLTGRVIAAVASGVDLIAKSGQAFTITSLASELGIDDGPARQ